MKVFRRLFGLRIFNMKNKNVVRLTENELRGMISESIKRILFEFKNNQGYSHFAVSKKSGKIINGWDYKDYDPEELRQFKKDYFDADLIDYGFNPKDFRILSYKYLVRNGINPDDDANWANNDEADAEWVG